MAFPSSLPLYLDDPPTPWNQQQQQQHNQVLHLQQQQQPPPPPLVHDHQDGLASASASASTRPNSMAERARLAKIPQPEQALKCPRCESTNTKFCYFNNYSLSQPRHFCKACRRYWTRGGSLRSVPVGGGCRRNNKRSHSKSKPSSTPAAASAGPTSLPALPSTNMPNIGLGFPGVQDMGVEQWRLNQFQQMYDFNELVKMEDNNLRGQFWGGEGSSSGGGGGGGGGGGWMFNSSGFNPSSTGSLL